MSTKIDIGQRLRASINHRKEIGNIVPEDQIPGAEASAVGDRLIPVDKIIPSPYQPRLRIEQEQLEQLAENIKEVGGLIQAIVVRPLRDGRYEIVAGERRWRAFMLCGYREIPAIVRHLSDQDALRMCVAENIQRENLSAYEVAKALRSLKDAGLSNNNSELSRLTGINRTNIVFHFRFFDLPEAVLDILNEEPSLIGAKTANDLARLCESGHGDLVLKSVEMIRDGKLLSTKAADWVLAHAKGRPPAPERRIFMTRDGQKIGHLSRTNNKIHLSCKDDRLVEQVAELIERLMSEAASSWHDEGG